MLPNFNCNIMNENWKLLSVHNMLLSDIKRLILQQALGKGSLSFESAQWKVSQDSLT